jgi:hypothetical protein
VTQNVMQLWPEILAVGVGALILFLFALTVALPHRPKTLPGSSGHREEEEESVHEEIRTDGYIDSFNKKIEEAGGALPWIVRLAIPGILIWWLIYLILNWTPR